eukprot:2939921-Pleurochrysis_carterae.AAC.1
MLQDLVYGSRCKACAVATCIVVCDSTNQRAQYEGEAHYAYKLQDERRRWTQVFPRETPSRSWRVIACAKQTKIEPRNPSSHSDCRKNASKNGAERVLSGKHAVDMEKGDEGGSSGEQKHFAELRRGQPVRAGQANREVGAASRERR